MLLIPLVLMHLYFDGIYTLCMNVFFSFFVFICFYCILVHVIIVDELTMKNSRQLGFGNK